APIPSANLYLIDFLSIVHFFTIPLKLIELKN
ncbi:MAG: hypothetical protein ACI8W0_001730, partial [Flavobacterium sp.]